MLIASVVGLPHERVSRHVFRGGNVLMPRILNRHRDELAVAALPQELETTVSQTLENLQTAAARLAVEGAEIANGRLTAQLVVSNLAGHKLPSAYPSRRVWLHVVVRDAGGRVVFESGRPEPDGSIAGNDNDADPARFEPHYELVSQPDQVQIYEPILADPDGGVTTVLLSALSYAKDNRLLPTGFDKATAEPAIAVHGRAQNDADFTAGGDRVRYRVAVRESEGPFTIEAGLWYQPIGFRWAHNLKDQKAPEIDRFVGYFEEMAHVSGAVLATAQAVTQ